MFYNYKKTSCIWLCSVVLNVVPVYEVLYWLLYLFMRCCIVYFVRLWSVYWMLYLFMKCWIVCGTYLWSAVLIVLFVYEVLYSLLLGGWIWQHRDMFPLNPNFRADMRCPQPYLEYTCHTSRFYTSPIPYLARLLNKQYRKTHL